MYGMVETKDEGRNGEKKGIINKIWTAYEVNEAKDP